MDHEIKYNNLVVCQRRIAIGGELIWSPSTALRYNFSRVSRMDDQNDLLEKTDRCFYKIENAVNYGRKISKELGIPLTCSCMYLDRPETAGLKMWGE
ncbi:MAG: hypothetical protein PHS93_08545 [Candidatus Omnitrophica bacterium]|nr:hypothetical protein [Candidatus Omnitrophota bacterium]